jgi:hypothetical protein
MVVMSSNPKTVEHAPSDDLDRSAEREHAPPVWRGHE